MTRRLWNRNRTTDQGVSGMGSEWHDGTTPRVSNLERPRISPVENGPAGEPEYADKAWATHDARVQTALEEGERARKIMADDARLYRVALEEFVQRVKAFPELGGPEASTQQAAELDTLAVLLTKAQMRGTILRARRRDGTGLYRQMDGGVCPADHRDYGGAGMCREETCPAYGMHSATGENL